MNDPICSTPALARSGPTGNTTAKNSATECVQLLVVDSARYWAVLDTDLQVVPTAKDIGMRNLPLKSFA